jgi:hypothetical protein
MEPSSLPSPFEGEPEVGEFRRGSEVSRWALALYLVGRAAAEYVSGALYGLALVLLVAGAGLWWLVSAWLGVPVVVIGLLVLGLRALVTAMLRAVTGAGQFGPIEARLRALVYDTRSDVRRELRRIGLPSRAWTLPLLALRLAGRNRAETLRRVRAFDLNRVISPFRLDELHLLLQQSGLLRSGGF